MSNIDIISMAVHNLFKRKLRTFLTILGVVIGTAAIVIMISLGIAMNESFDQQLQQMGDITIITVYDPNYWNEGGSRKGEETDITKASVDSFKKIKGVAAATPVADESLKFSSGKYVANFQIRGIDASVMEQFNYKLEEGRLLDENDDNTLNMVFGSEIPYQFYKSNNRRDIFMTRGGNGEEREPPPIDVLNDKILMSYDQSLGEKTPSYTTPTDEKPKKKVKPYKIKCVGVLKSGDYNTDYFSFISLTQLEKITSEKEKYQQALYNNSRTIQSKKGYQTALVKCESIDDVLNVQNEIKALGFEASSNLDYVSGMQEISKSLQALLGAIGAVSLFIAAIGITNTMIMAIYERTREIGIMKVIGAQIKDIKKLFLLEAILIGFFGGLFGIGISLLISVLLNHVKIPFLNMMSYGEEGTKISSIPFWLCISALCFSSFVGLISGYFPARRAMRLSALTAIKAE